MIGDTTTKILASSAAALAGFGITWVALASRSTSPASNPSAKQSPLMKRLDNTDSYMVSPKEAWLAEILENSDPRFPEIAEPDKYFWRMYGSVPIRLLKPGKIGGTGSDMPILVNHLGEVVSGTERLAVQNHLGAKTVTVIVAAPIDSDEGSSR